MNGGSGGSGSNKKSLLGYDDPDADALLKTTHEQMRFFSFLLFLFVFLMGAEVDWPMSRNWDNLQRDRSYSCAR